MGRTIGSYGATMPHRRVAAVAALFADPTRAAILTALLDQRFATPGELATQAGVSRSTVSGHLARLEDGGLIEVTARGRHRYVRLAGPQVADLLERLGAAETEVGPARSVRAPSALRFARTCYDHLAGVVAVRFHRFVRAEGWVVGPEDGATVTEAGAEGLARFGVEVAASCGGSDARLRSCVDWTERHYHLGGAVGRAVLTAWSDRGWLVPGTARRALRVSASGRAALGPVLTVDDPHPLRAAAPGRDPRR